MGFILCLSTCSLVFILGLAAGQESATDEPIILDDHLGVRQFPETTTEKPIILDDHPGKRQFPARDPPMFTPPNNAEAVRIPMKEDFGGFENVNPTHVNGEELFESDILLSPEQRRQFLERKAIPSLSSRWPNGPNGTPVVPYQFGDTAVSTTAVEAGLAHWKEHTCIDFQLITGTPPSSYLNFIKGSGCWSYVGMQPSPQDLSIGTGCSSLGTVAHEVGHAMGFFHEQSRSDRDGYVTIILANVQAGKEGNFQKSVDNNYSLPYDFSSDMHYGSNYFSVNGKNTIVTKNPLAQELIGNRYGLSHYDKLLANTMYPCITKWMQNCGITTNPCLNDGYVGKNCSCVCRSGTSGTHCETVIQGYYDSLLSGCSANVTAPGTVTSPNYPNHYSSGIKCVKWIQAPVCTTVKIKFNSFRLYGRDNYCDGNSCCYFDSLEIRTTSLTVGEVYCDQDIVAGTEFTSPSNQMILFFQTGTNFYSGWSVNVTFEPVPSCQPETTSTSASVSTTTSTSTSTSASTTSTATSTGDACGVAELGPGAIEWTSPNFGVGKYPNGESCALSVTSRSPKWAQITLNTFSLGRKDRVSLQRPLFSALTLTGLKYGTRKLPSANFDAEFVTNARRNGIGFNITIVSKASNCHKLITTGDVGDTGTIAAPRQPNYTWQKKACEFWIRSPIDTRIQLDFTSMAMSVDCAVNSVVVNGAGDVTYPSDSSDRYCGTSLPPSTTSAANKMNVLFFSKGDANLFSATWTVVAA